MTRSETGITRIVDDILQTNLTTHEAMLASYILCSIFIRILSHDFSIPLWSTIGIVAAILGDE